MTPLILIATPHYGHPDQARVPLAYMQAQIAICRDPSVQILGAAHSDSDLVRARSRIVRDALGTEMTHLLFWDDDVIAEPARLGVVVRGMLAADVDVIACPYPRRRLHWDTAARAAKSGRDPEAYAVEYGTIAVKEPGSRAEGWSEVAVTRGAVECATVNMGFTLITRACLETMADHYRQSLGFSDVVGPDLVPTVALFQLVLTSGNPRVLLSEDYSFCHRWREIGGKVHAYVGDGAPLDHVGPYVYRGLRDGLFHARDTEPAPPND